jgi:hypothetical protein
LLSRAAEDVAAGGIVWGILRGHDMDPPGSALALRFMGAVHRLVLWGQAPRLAAYYPSAGGSARGDAWDEFHATVLEHSHLLRDEVRQSVQTNEVGRCAALIGGFLEVARMFSLPLRVLEIGSSAGLNLRWNDYRYEARGRSWGDPRSSVRLCSYNSDVALPFDVEAEVVHRIGCDRNPLDASSSEDALRLLGFVWPDQVNRIRMLRSAIENASRSPVVIDRAPGSDWLADRLQEREPGVATVVFHSVVEPYMEAQEIDAMMRLLVNEGSGRDAHEPLAHLRMEEGDETGAEVTLQVWPGDSRHVIARSSYHGENVRWMGY